MSRSAREKSESGAYHIILRGINRQTVFYDNEDKEVFLNRLKVAKEKFRFSVYAFCFMGNHIHLVLREKEIGIGKIMQQILSSYIFWYNSKYERIGNLFQDRFKSEAIKDDSYLLCAVRYVHQNPVKAKLVESVEEYNWSSYGAYLIKKDSLIDKKLILDILQGKEGYIEFMNETEGNNFLEPSEKYRISDEKLLKEIKNKLQIKDMSEVCKLSKTARNDALKKILEIDGANHFQVSRVTGIPMGIVRYIE